MNDKLRVILDTDVTVLENIFDVFSLLETTSVTATFKRLDVANTVEGTDDVATLRIAEAILFIVGLKVTAPEIVLVIAAKIELTTLTLLVRITPTILFKDNAAAVVTLRGIPIRRDRVGVASTDVERDCTLT